MPVNPRDPPGPPGLPARQTVPSTTAAAAAAAAAAAEDERCHPSTSGGSTLGELEPSPRPPSGSRRGVLLTKWKSGKGKARGREVWVSGASSLFNFWLRA